MKLNVKKVFVFILFSICSVQIFSASKKSQNKKNDRNYEKVKVIDVVNDEGAFQSKSLENQAGAVKFQLNAKVGSFQFFYMDKKGSMIPLLSSYDKGSTSFFSILAGRKEYKLSGNSGIVIGTRKGAKGAQIVYIIPGIARLFVKFEAIKSEDSKVEDIIKVTCVLKNRGKSTNLFALKNVLDTYLGEQRGFHFSTSDSSIINNEVQFRKFDTLKWVKSENKNAGMQVLFSGGNITTPSLVTLSNKDFLMQPSWETKINQSRSFDSLLSYNNSAIAMNWDPVVLQPDEEQTYVYYIALASDGENPKGDEFIAELTKYIEENGEEVQYSVKEFEDAYQKAAELARSGDFELALSVVNELWEKPEHRNGRLESLKNYIETQMQNAGYVPSKVTVKDESENAEENTAAETAASDSASSANSAPASDIQTDLTKAEADNLYIQELIDRIYALQGNGDVDRDEIIRLNAELDAIMRDLRD